MFTFASPMKQPRKIGARDWIMFSGLSGIWGFSFFFIKKGLLFFDPLQVAALRMSIAFLALLPLILLNLKRLRMPLSRLRYVPMLGLFGNLIPAILFCTAETQIDSGLTGIMNSTTPLFALLIGNVLFRVKLTQNKILGVIIGFVGALIIVLSKQRSFTQLNIYILLPLLATICYGLNANILKTKFQQDDPLVIALLQYSFIAPLTIAYLLLSGAFHQVIQHPLPAWNSLRYLLLLGILGTGYAQVFFNILTQRTSALFATMTTYLIPLVSVIVGLLDHERILPVHFAGLATIMIGIYIGSRN